jgi:hypothetical protein
VAQHCIRCRAYVNVVINRRVLAGNFLISLNNSQVLKEDFVLSGYVLWK